MRVFIRPPVESDIPALLDLHCRSRSFHAPWSFPALTQEGCQAYVQRCQADNFQGLLICQQDSGSIIGVANLSQIFYGAFQNAYLGYYADVTYAGLGLMGEGMGLVINYAFSTLTLHRIEANIQPGNTRSIKLVKRLGFRQEGYSPRYLKIDGEWRDHERWALTTEDCV
ncbi:MAG: GNAT family N-acetyltransferase [Leptolyngbyaceae bacterium]|nr:GNAT family N-acetyltransferase [Leptolyngbyaceae bacterium]